MRAVIAEQPGPPEVLQLREVGGGSSNDIAELGERCAVAASSVSDPVTEHQQIEFLTAHLLEDSQIFSEL